MRWSEACSLKRERRIPTLTSSEGLAPDVFAARSLTARGTWLHDPRAARKFAGWERCMQVAARSLTRDQ